MTMVVSKYWIAVILATAFAVGTTVGGVTTTFVPFLGIGASDASASGDRIDKISNDLSALSQRMETISGTVGDMKASLDGGAMTVGDSGEITSIKKEIKLINAKLKDLAAIDNIEEDVARLQDNLAKLEVQINDGAGSDSAQKASVQLPASLFSAELDSLTYEAGNSLRLSGVGVPGMPVDILLLAADGVTTVSEGSTTVNSAGNFVYLTELSPSLSAGTYKIRASQGQELIEREFTIVESLSPDGEGSDMTISAERSEVERGDRLLIHGTADPDTFVDLDIFDENDFQISRISVKSDSTGKFRYSYGVDSDDKLGTYTIIATNGDKQASVKFAVVDSATATATDDGSTPPSAASDELTISTSKPEYQRGDLVVITGKAQPGTKVSITIEPPSGDNFLLTVNSEMQGNYRTVFAVKTDAEQGVWNLTVEQDGISAKTTIDVV